MPSRIVLAILCALAAVGGVSCKRETTSARPSTHPAGATVASLVPAATDLIIAMGRADRLVAVSNYDSPRGADKPLPKVGDYQTTDWEQIRTLRPAVMIRQFAPDRVPPGLKERCDELGIRLVNLRFGKLDDVFTSLDTIGQSIDAPADAAALSAKIHAQLDAVRSRVADQPKPRVLLVLGESAENIIGPGEFMDDLLTIAGGINAAGGLKNKYPSIDREMLRSLDPEVIIQILPEAAPQKVAQAKQTWAGLTDLKAVRTGRVHQLTEWYIQQPGAHVGDIAEQFARCVHPSVPATRPVSIAPRTPREPRAPRSEESVVGWGVEPVRLLRTGHGLEARVTLDPFMPRTGYLLARRDAGILRILPVWTAFDCRTNLRLFSSPPSLPLATLAPLASWRNPRDAKG